MQPKPEIDNLMEAILNSWSARIQNASDMKRTDETSWNSNSGLSHPQLAYAYATLLASLCNFFFDK